MVIRCDAGAVAIATLLLLVTSRLSKCQMVASEDDFGAPMTDYTVPVSGSLLYHSLDSGRTYKLLGALKPKSLSEMSVNFESVPFDLSFNSADLDNLKSLIAERGFYMIKLIPESTNAPASPDASAVHSSIPVCVLLNKEFNYGIQLYYNSAGRLMGANIQPRAQQASDWCSTEGLQPIIDGRMRPVISINARSIAAAPMPDTQGYLDKMEKEKIEKARTAQQDNRSFIAKYWMYIVPAVVIFIVMNSAGDNASR